MKTNKSYAKRLKISKRGRITTRKSGQNHFNAKESARSKASKKRNVEFPMTNKEKSRFLVNI